MILFALLPLLFLLINASESGKGKNVQQRRQAAQKGHSQKQVTTENLAQYHLTLPDSYTRFNVMPSHPDLRRYSGLLNSDLKTCYMACIVQTLFHLKPVRKAILGTKVTEASNPIILGLQRVLQALQQKYDGKPVNMYPTLVRLYREYPPIFADARKMDDAREFLAAVFQRLEPSARKILGGTQIRRSIRSPDGVVLSDDIQPEPQVLVTIAVDLLRKGQSEINSLQKWINAGGDFDQIEGYVLNFIELNEGQRQVAEKYMKDKHNNDNPWDIYGRLEIPGSVIKQESIHKPGDLLTFFLRRYDTDEASMQQQIYQPVFQPDLHFHYERTLTVKEHTYELQAVVHYDEMHYKTYTRSAHYRDQWLLLNSETVTKVTEAEALSHLGNAYMVIYARQGFLPMQDQTESAPVQAEQTTMNIYAPQPSSSPLRVEQTKMNIDTPQLNPSTKSKGQRGHAPSKVAEKQNAMVLDTRSEASGMRKGQMATSKSQTMTAARPNPNQAHVRKEVSWHDSEGNWTEEALNVWLNFLLNLK